MWSAKKSNWNHLQNLWWPFESMYWSSPSVIQNNPERNQQDLYWWIFYWLTHCLMHSVKCSGKLAMTTALFLGQKCLATCGKRTFTILLMPTCIHYYSLTVLALILLYGGHCFSVWLPSKSCSGFPHCIIIFPQYMLVLKAVSRSWHV